MPGGNGIAFVTYEVPITNVLYLKSTVGKDNLSSIRIVAKQDKGYLLLNGQEMVMKDIRLRFVSHSCRGDFVNAFNRAQSRFVRNSQSAPLQHQESQPTAEKVSVKIVDLPSVDEEDERQMQKDDTAAGLPKVSVKTLQEQQPSSDSYVQQTYPPSGIFAKDDRLKKKADTRFTKALRASRSQSSVDQAQVCVAILENEVEDDSFSHSSPLKCFGKRKRGQDSGRDAGPMDTQSNLRSGNLTLSLPLQHTNDPDFAAFQGVIPRANIAAEHNNIQSVSNDRLTKKYVEPAGKNGLKSDASNSARKRVTIGPRQPKSEPEMARRTIKNRLAEAADSHTSFEHDEENLSPSAKRTKLPDTKTGKSKLPKVSRETLSKTTTSLTHQPALKRSSRQTQKLDGGKHRKQPAEAARPESGQNEQSENDWQKVYRAKDDNRSSSTETPSVTAKQMSGRALRDKTNVAQTKPEVIQKASQLANTKEITTKKSNTASRSTKITAAPVRPKRSTNQNYADYFEPPELDSEQQDTLVIQKKAIRISDTERQASTAVQLIYPRNEKLKPRAAQSTMADFGEINVLSGSEPEHVVNPAADKHADDDTVSRNWIKVPSSDPVNISKQGTEQPCRAISGKQVEVSSTDEIASGDEDIAEDSYPIEAHNQAQPDDFDKSFGSKLKDFAMITPVLPCSEVRSLKPSFGNSTQFIHNINAARSSASKIKVAINPLPPRLGLSRKRASVSTSDADVMIAPQSQNKPTPEEVTATVNVEALPGKIFQAEDESGLERSGPALADKQFEVSENHEKHGDRPVAAANVVIAAEDNIGHANVEVVLADDADLLENGCDTTQGGETEASCRQLERSENQSSSLTTSSNAERPVDKDVRKSPQTCRQSEHTPEDVLTDTISLPISDIPIDVQLGETPSAASRSAVVERSKTRDTLMQPRRSKHQPRQTNLPDSSLRMREDRMRDEIKALPSLASRSGEAVLNNHKSSIIHFGTTGPENQGTPMVPRRLFPVRQRQSETASTLLEKVHFVSQSATTHAHEFNDDDHINEQDDTGIMADEWTGQIAPSGAGVAASSEGARESGTFVPTIVVEGNPKHTLPIPSRTDSKEINVITQPVNNHIDIYRAQESLEGAKGDTTSTSPFTEHISEQKSEFLASDTHLKATPELSTLRVTRRGPKAALEELTERYVGSEQAATSKERIKGLANKDMEQVPLQGPQQFDDISLYNQQQYLNAKEKIAASKIALTDHHSKPGAVFHSPKFSDAQKPLEKKRLSYFIYEKDRTKQRCFDDQPVQLPPVNTINDKAKSNIAVSTTGYPPSPSMAAKLQDAQLYQQRQTPTDPNLNRYNRVSQPASAQEETVATNKRPETIVRRLVPASTSKIPTPVAEYPASDTPQSYLAGLYATTPYLPQVDHVPLALGQYAIPQPISDNGDTTLIGPDYSVGNVARHPLLLLSDEQPSNPQTDTPFVRKDCDQSNLASDRTVENSHRNLGQTVISALHVSVAAWQAYIH